MDGFCKNTNLPACPHAKFGKTANQKSTLFFTSYSFIWLVFSFYLQTSRVAHHFFCLCPRSAYNSLPSVPPGVLEQRNWGPSVYTYSQWWHNQQCLFVCWLSGLLSPSLATAMNSWAPIFEHLPASQILLFYVRHFFPPTKYTQNPELFLFFFHIDFLPR